MSLSQWHDEGTIGEVRLGSISMRGLNPEMEGLMDGHCKESQRCSQVGARGYSSKRARGVRGSCEGFDG